MKKKWLYLCGCLVAPHIMFVVGIAFLSRKDLQHKSFGLKLCRWSTAVLIIGSLSYYMFFTPLGGLD